MRVALKPECERVASRSLRVEMAFRPGGKGGFTRFTVMKLVKAFGVGRKIVEHRLHRLAGWQGEKTLLDERLSDPTLYAAGAAALLSTLQKRQGELAAAIEDAEMRWLEVQESLEGLA